MICRNLTISVLIRVRGKKSHPVHPHNRNPRGCRIYNYLGSYVSLILTIQTHYCYTITQTAICMKYLQRNNIYFV